MPHRDPSQSASEGPGRSEEGRSPRTRGTLDLQNRSGAALREAIRRAGLSYETVAHRLGLKGRSSVAQWCSGIVPVPIRYHQPLRQALRAPDLFPDSTRPMLSAEDDGLLRSLLDAYAVLPELPLDLVERTSWELWRTFGSRGDWHRAGRYVETLYAATGHWRERLGGTCRRLERIRWAAEHGRIRSSLYTCNWEHVAQLSHSLRQAIYRSPWLDVLDYPEQALILNTLSLADFFLKSRFRRIGSGPARSVSALRNALTQALTHLGEAERRLRLPKSPNKPSASSLRVEVAQLLLDATEASMIYEAREDPGVAGMLTLLADRAASMAAALPSAGPPDLNVQEMELDHSPGTGPAGEMTSEYRNYLAGEIFPRIELECRYNAALIGALESENPGLNTAVVERSAIRLQELEKRAPSEQQWRAELRMTELYRILQAVIGSQEAIPRDASLQMRHNLGDLREDFHRYALMGPARSAATLEILLDVNLVRLPDTPCPEREERLHAAAELVDWMNLTLDIYPDTPSGLVAQWDGAALTLLSGVREASTVRDLGEILQQFREYGGRRIPETAARFLARVAEGEFGTRAAAAVPGSIRETLPPSGPHRAGGADMMMVLSPLLYPMMPISFLRPEGYSDPSRQFWEEECE